MGGSSRAGDLPPGVQGCTRFRFRSLFDRFWLSRFIGPFANVVGAVGHR